MYYNKRKIPFYPLITFVSVILFFDLITCFVFERILKCYMQSRISVISALKSVQRRSLSLHLMGAEYLEICQNLLEKSH